MDSTSLSTALGDLSGAQTSRDEGYKHILDGLDMLEEVIDALSPEQAAKVLKEYYQERAELDKLTMGTFTEEGGSEGMEGRERPGDNKKSSGKRD